MTSNLNDCVDNIKRSSYSGREVGRKKEKMKKEIKIKESKSVRGVEEIWNRM